MGTNFVTSYTNFNIDNKRNKFKYHSETELYLERNIPNTLQLPKTLNLGNKNKVFCSKWIDESQIVFGTKCNTLCHLQVCCKHLSTIPLLRSSKRSRQALTPSGIHAIAINPSGTVLATGGYHTNDVAFYRLPYFTPLAIGEGGHEDWHFELEWFDDEFLVSCLSPFFIRIYSFLPGGRDGHIVFWYLPSDPDVLASSPEFAQIQPDFDPYPVVWPVAVRPRQCESPAATSVAMLFHEDYVGPNQERMRSLRCNRRRNECISMLQSNFDGNHSACDLLIWDVGRGTTFDRKLRQRISKSFQEAVCLALHEERQLVAIGINGYVHLICAETLRSVKPVTLPLDVGARSLSFRGDTMTVGTSLGDILFYDLRRLEFVQNDITGGVKVLRMPEAHVNPDANQYNWFPPVTPREWHSVYTHAFNPAGTKLFAAGGPLPIALSGNFAAIWESCAAQ